MNLDELVVFCKDKFEEIDKLDKKIESYDKLEEIKKRVLKKKSLIFLSYDVAVITVDLIKNAIRSNDILVQLKIDKKKEIEDIIYENWSRVNTKLHNMNLSEQNIETTNKYIEYNIKKHFFKEETYLLLETKEKEEIIIVDDCGIPEDYPKEHILLKDTLKQNIRDYLKSYPKIPLKELTKIIFQGHNEQSIKRHYNQFFKEKAEQFKQKLKEVKENE